MPRAASRIVKAAALASAGMLAFPRASHAATRIVIETEDLAGPWRTQTNIPGYRGRGFRVSNARGIARDGLRGEIPIPHGGRWFIWTRGYEGDDADRRFRVVLGGEALAPTHAGRTALAFPDRGRPEAVGARNLKRLIAETGRERPPLARTALSAEAWLARRRELAPRVRAALGLDPPPPRTPLRARTVGAIARDGYRIEKVVFESRPGFPVPANLYLPAADAPAPAVLCPVGHWGKAKAEPRVQARAMALARQGMAALVYDPIGQGERAVDGNGHGTAKLAWLAGECNMTYMVWDSIRAIDYLQGRSEVDPHRIGATGCSGGGLNTLYLEAVEPRLRATAPVCYVVTFRSFLATRIAHCPCSHVPGLGAFTDMAEVAAIAAPTPQLVIGGEQDPMFTARGMRTAFGELQALYGALGVADRVELFMVDAPHDYNRPMRERAVGFMARYLQGRGDGSPIPEAPWKPEPPEALFCFPGGRVPASSRTYRDLVLERIRALDRPCPARAVRADLARCLGLPTRGMPRVEDLSAAGARGSLPRKLLFTASDGYAFRGILVGPRDAESAVIHLGDAPIEDLAAEGAIDALRPPAAAALLVEPRFWDRRSGGGHVAWTDGVLLGRPAAAGWARDLAEAARWLRGRCDRVAIVARGPAPSIAAMLAAAADPGAFDACVLEGAPRGWDALARTPLPAGAFLPGLAKVGSPRALVAAAGDVPILWFGEAPPAPGPRHGGGTFDAARAAAFIAKALQGR